MKNCYNIEETETCTYCGQPIYIHRESHINDIGSTIFHSNCYGKYIALVLRHKPEEANLTLNKEVPVKYLSPGDSFYN